MPIPSSQTTADRAGLAPAAALFRSLGDPARLAIMRRLALGTARVTDLASELRLTQSTVSGHLACLRECGLVTAQAAGRASVYSLAQPSLAELPTAAEDLPIRGKRICLSDGSRGPFSSLNERFRAPG